MDSLMSSLASGGHAHRLQRMRSFVTRLTSSETIELMVMVRGGSLARSSTTVMKSCTSIRVISRIIRPATRRAVGCRTQSAAEHHPRERLVSSHTTAKRERRWVRWWPETQVGFKSCSVAVIQPSWHQIYLPSFVLEPWISLADVAA